MLPIPTYCHQDQVREVLNCLTVAMDFNDPMVHANYLQNITIPFLQKPWLNLHSMSTYQRSNFRSEKGILSTKAVELSQDSTDACLQSFTLGKMLECPSCHLHQRVMQMTHLQEQQWPLHELSHCGHSHIVALAGGHHSPAFAHLLQGHR